MKVDSPSLTDKQILEERIDNYAITNLSNEIIEMILVDAVKFSKNSTEICSRFNSILKQKKDALLTHIHKEDQSEHSKNHETFGLFSGVTTSLTEIVYDKK